MRALTATVVLTIVLAAPALARVKIPKPHLPATTGAWTYCPKPVVYKLEGKYPVSVQVAPLKGKHPSTTLLTCTHAAAVALAGKKDYHKRPFGLGKKIKVAGATYELGATHLFMANAPTYGWWGDGIEIYLDNPT